MGRDLDARGAAAEVVARAVFDHQSRALEGQLKKDLKTFVLKMAQAKVRIGP